MVNRKPILIYVSTTYFGDGSKVEEALNDLSNLGIKNIELGSNHAPLAQNKVNLDKNSTYIVHNYFPPKEKDFILNIASTTPAIRQKSINFIKSTILLCQMQKIKYYTIHPGFLAEAISPLGYKGKNRNFDLKFSKESIVGKDRKKIIQEAAKVIEEFYEFAQSKVQLLVENQGSKTSKDVTIFDSLTELQLLKKTVGRNLKFNFNLAHAMLSGIEVKKADVFKFIYENSPFFEVSEIKGIYDSHLPVFPKKGVIGNLLAQKKTLFKKRNLILEYRNIYSKDVKSSFESVNNFFN